jgi:hypothetical protein
MKKLIIALSLVSILLFAWVVPVSANVSGTSLDASVTAVATWQTIYHWTITKSADPDKWILSGIETGNSIFTITLTKDNGTTDTPTISGVVSVTNSGGAATTGLAIVVTLDAPTGGIDLGPMNVDVSGNPILDPDPNYPTTKNGETGIYSYSFSVPSPVAGTYKVTADVTITNHSGPGGVVTKGPSPSATTAFPSSPTVINNTIHVTDIYNGTILSGPWTFNSSGSQTYTKTYTAADNRYNPYTNIATITETGQSATAGVLVSTPLQTVLPELPAAALFGLGLAGIGAFFIIRRRRSTASTR